MRGNDVVVKAPWETPPGSYRTWIQWVETHCYKICGADGSL